MNSRFEFEFKKRVGQEIERVREVLASGLGVKDYAEYRYYVGQLVVLSKIVDEYWDEVQSQLNKE